VLIDSPEIDRTTINSWEDIEFRQAVDATGRRQADHGRVVDRDVPGVPGARRAPRRLRRLPRGGCRGRYLPEAHRAGLERIVRAGAEPISWVSLAGELQRDWNRLDTVADVVDIVLTTRLLAHA
jgi:hypothetical protein